MLRVGFFSQMCFPQTKNNVDAQNCDAPAHLGGTKSSIKVQEDQGWLSLDHQLPYLWFRPLKLDVPTNQWWSMMSGPTIDLSLYYGRGLRWYGWYMWLVILASLLHLIWYHWRNLGAVPRCSWVLEWWCLWYRWWTSWDTENTAMNWLDIRISTNTGFI